MNSLTSSLVVVLFVVGTYLSYSLGVVRAPILGTFYDFFARSILNDRFSCDFSLHLFLSAFFCEFFFFMDSNLEPLFFELFLFTTPLRR